MSQAPTVDACRCPLCGGPNHCAMASVPANTAQAPCWCTREQFSAQLLQQVPPALQGQTCICRACVRGDQMPS